jgi:hypothetical protein
VVIELLIETGIVSTNSAFLFGYFRSVGLFAGSWQEDLCVPLAFLDPSSKFTSKIVLAASHALSLIVSSRLAPDLNRGSDNVSVATRPQYTFTFS